MTVRVFRCGECGHRMRLTGARCGKCRSYKPLWQRPTTWLAALAGAAVAAALLTRLAQ